MNRDFIEGAKDRATKNSRSPMSRTPEYDRGWDEMTKILSPIETEIITATIRYKVEAENFVKTLEDKFCDGDCADSAGLAAVDAHQTPGIEIT